MYQQIAIIILIGLLVLLIFLLYIGVSTIFGAVDIVYNNTIFCDSEPAKCDFDASEINLALPFTEKMYNPDVARSLLKMIKNIYSGKVPIPDKGYNWYELTTSYNPDPIGYISEINDLNFVILRGLDYNVLSEVNVNTQFVQEEFMGSMCHSGYVDIINQYKDDIINRLSNNNNPIVIAGHSMGGANSMLIAYSIKKLQPDRKVILYTFGSPRVCDCTLDMNFSNFVYFNIQNRTDAITDIAPSVTTGPRDRNKLYFYCSYGTQRFYQDNRMSFGANHALVNYYMNVESLLSPNGNTLLEK